MGRAAHLTRNQPSLKLQSVGAQHDGSQLSEGHGQPAFPMLLYTMGVLARWEEIPTWKRKG